MQISLETIRELLRSTLGHDSFTAGFVRSVEEDPGIPTACISADGVLRYNPAFVEEQVKTGQDLFCLVFHEILHPAFGHFSHPNDAIANIACDAVINAVISQLYRPWSDNGALFRRFYPEQGLTAILRPESRMMFSRYEMLYERLYPLCSLSEKLSAGEVIQSLRVLVPRITVPVTLLGTHYQPGPGRPSAGIKAEDYQRICEDLAKNMPKSGKNAGHYEGLTAMLMEVLKSRKTLRQTLLTAYTTRRKMDLFFIEEQRQRRITSPFPINPSRRDVMLLSAGIWPGLFRNRQSEVHYRKQGVAIFLDVSGSVLTYLPEIIGMLAHYRDWLATIYIFSNRVVEIPFPQLCQGTLSTSFGTDFDCVAEEILKKEFAKAVVITDGYASMNQTNAQALGEAKTRVLTILFGGKADCPEWEDLGEVVKLEEVTME